MRAITPPIIPIIKMFKYEAEIRGVLIDMSNVSVAFIKDRKKNSKTVAYCARDHEGKPMIRVYLEPWVKMTDHSKEHLIFHEVGHCILDRRHCGFETEYGPISIMFKKVLDSSYYKDNREELLDELFNISERCDGYDDESDEGDRTIRPSPDFY